MPQIRRFWNRMTGRRARKGKHMIRKNKVKKVICGLLTGVLVMTGAMSAVPAGYIMAQAAGINNGDFLKTDGKEIKTNYGNGEVVYLRGTNAGGYLLQEFWMTPTASTGSVHSEIDIYHTLTERFGENTMRELIGVYQDNYWTESDFDNCRALGMNCIRLPFWYLNFVDFNGNYLDNCFERIDWFLAEAGERGMYVILDFHGAPGSQNGSDHSGVDGGNNKEGASEFFFGANARENQQLYYDIWEKIARRYKDNPVVAGYDLLNEPYCTYRYNSSRSETELHQLLWDVYDQAYDVIRSVDPNHIIIMEATWDSWDLPDPNEYGWQNVMYEYHNYLYDDYDNAGGGQIRNMQNKVNNINSAGYNVPSYMGEFSYFSNYSAWDEGLKLLNNSNIHWTSWTYKVTGSNNSWGIYNQNVADADISSDSAAAIRTKWSQVGSSYQNTQLANVMKKYLQAAPEAEAGRAVLANGDYCLTAIANDKVVCADNTGADPLIANRESFGGDWEKYTLVNNSDGTVSLRSAANNKYVCAVIDENNQLLARSNSISTWEKFEIHWITDNQYGIKAIANGKFVKADLDDNGILKAGSDSIAGAWEAFIITGIN